MANRPGKLCELHSGKAIGASVHQQFADTFNWLVACMKNLKAGRGIKLKWPSDDTPEISLDGGEDDGDSGGGGGDITFNGTDDTSTTSSQFTFASEVDSNVTVNCSEGTLTIGVYYS